MRQAARTLATALCLVMPGLARSQQPAVVLTPEAEAQLSAADQKRADQLKGEANVLFRDGRYKEAIEKFSRAFEISRDVELVYSIGVSYQNLEAWQECVSYMERYLEKAGVGPKRDRAENTRKSCEARIERDQELTIESTPAGAKVYIDDRARGVQGTTPFRNYVKPGSHRVWVELDGFEATDQTIEVQKATPFRMNVQLREVQNRGWLFVDSTVIDARVYIDGKNVGLTPFQAPLAYSAGSHQVVVERDGYTRYSSQIRVDKGRLARVDAHLVQTSAQSTWRSPLGWTMNVFGLLAIGGGVTAYFFAEEEFNDTDKFKDLALYEKLGYGVGGGLMAIGTSLLIWDAVRDVIADEDRNPKYGEPVKIQEGAAAEPTALRFGVSPGGVSLGFSF
ncbi:MAG: PEGA domain-containing protein [Myxococcales bacterium]|nr:PEGA domain-containing protein [Myxococcales bacterium]